MAPHIRALLFPPLMPRIGRWLERIALIITGSLSLGFALCALGIWLLGMVAI